MDRTRALGEYQDNEMCSYCGTVSNATETIILETCSCYNRDGPGSSITSHSTDISLNHTTFISNVNDFPNKMESLLRELTSETSREYTGYFMSWASTEWFPNITCGGAIYCADCVLNMTHAFFAYNWASYTGF